MAKAKSKGQGGLLVARNDGLGARLMPIMNALRLGALLDVPVTIYWPTYLLGHNTSEVDTLFSQSFRDRCFVSAETYQGLRRTAKIRNEAEIGKLSGDALRAAIADGDYFFFENTEHDVALLDEDPEDVKAGLSACFPDDLLTPQVADQMAMIRDKLRDKPPLVYHVRHGDLTHSYKTRAGEWSNKYIPNEIYLAHMQTFGVDADHPAVMIGDCRASIDWITERHTGVARIDHMLDTAGLGSLQFDFMELYTMSRARKIVAPEHSGFSKMAARIGNLPVEDVKHSLPEDALEAALEDLEKRLWLDRDSFTNDGDAAQSILHLRKPDAPIPTVAMDGLIRREIEGGSTVPFLYRHLANAALRNGDVAGLRDTASRAHEAMLADPRVLSTVNAHAAQGLIETDHLDEGLQHLRRALYLTPTVPAMTSALMGFLTHDADAHLHPDFFPTGFSAELCQHNTVWRIVLLHGFAWETWPFLQARFRTLLMRGHGYITFVAHLSKLIKTLQAAGDTAASAQMLGLLRLCETYQGNKDAMGDLRKLADQSDPAIDPLPLQRLALAHLGVDDKSTAQDMFAQLVDARPMQRCYHGMLGYLMFQNKDLGGALHHLDIANPDGADFLQFAGPHIRLLDRAKRADEADAMFQSMLYETAWSDAHMTHYARRPLTADQAAPLIDRLQNALPEMGKARPVHAQLAALYNSQGDVAQANAHFTKALTLGVIPPALVRVAATAASETKDAALQAAFDAYQAAKSA